MRAKIPYGMVIGGLAGLVIAFWAGRASGPANPADLTESGRLGPRAAERPGTGGSGRRVEPGGGGQAVTSVQQLHGIFKNSGGYGLTGAVAADAALAKMNGTQLAQLVRNLASMVYATKSRDPATAFAWAATIGDDSRRVSLLLDVVWQWKESDPAKARAAVNQADLASDERQRLLKQIK